MYLKTFFIVTSLIVAGCTMQSSLPETDNPQVVDTAFSTIKEAVTKAIAIQCDYTDPEDGEKIKIYFKGQLIAFRPGENNPSPDIASLIKDNVVYLWNTKEVSEGLAIDLSKSTVKDNISIAGMEVRSNEDVINALEPHRKNCQPTSDLSVFELPANVNFKSE